MPIFDGVNLTITLDSGITEVDLINDVYEPWKDWMLASPINRGYPAAFRPDGGNPLSSIINQGSYIFLNNTAGWRMKPPEEDITVYLTGNLAVEDTTLPAFIPTTGAFTAAILGLQPVTQGVTPAMGSQLAFTAFQGFVCIDTINGFGGTGSIGFDEIGTRRAPSNNPTDALAIAVREGLTEFLILQNLTLSTADDFSAGYKFRGDSPHIQLTIDPAPNVTNCSMELVTLVGTLDGLNNVRDCSIHDCTDASGFFFNCAFKDTIVFNGDSLLMECFSNVHGPGGAIFDYGGGNAVTFRNYNGSIIARNLTVGHSTCSIHDGKFTAEATCTGGEIHIRGTPYAIEDNSTGTAEMKNETESIKVTEMWEVEGLDQSKPMTVIPTNRSVGTISQTITGDGETTTTVTRDP
jgi:hypothetical protein